MKTILFTVGLLALVSLPEPFHAVELRQMSNEKLHGKSSSKTKVKNKHKNQ